MGFSCGLQDCLPGEAGQTLKLPDAVIWSWDEARNQRLRCSRRLIGSPGIVSPDICNLRNRSSPHLKLASKQKGRVFRPVSQGFASACTRLLDPVYGFKLETESQIQAPDGGPLDRLACRLGIIGIARSFVTLRLPLLSLPPAARRSAKPGISQLPSAKNAASHPGRDLTRQDGS